jgi:hypothetical protein
MRLVAAATAGAVVPATTHGRLQTPDTRARVVGYLATAPEAAPGWRTDGTFVWPAGLAEAARRHGLAPPLELFLHMRRSWFLVPATVPPDRRSAAAELVARASVTHPSTVDAAGTAAPEQDRHHHARLMRAREAEPPEDAVRPARLFDAVGPDRTGWFSPGRLRIPEPERRGRLVGCLCRGRLVLRCLAGAPDPLDDRYRLRLGWRTDGVWVWPEALGHYVLTRGVAPELELLVHIERRGYAVADVDDPLARDAAGVARQPPAPLWAPSVRYLRDGAGRLVRAWGTGGAKPWVGDQYEVLRDDLRWGQPAEPIDLMAQALGLTPVAEAAAVAMIDERWARGDAVPALD